MFFFFFFPDTATTEIYTLSLHDALPIYADDIAIFASSERAAQRILKSVTEWLKKTLGLEVNREKSGSGPSGQSALLGFRLYEDGRIGIAPKAIAKLKEKVRECWEARQNMTSEQLRKQWRQRSEEHTSELQSRRNLVCRLLLEKKKKKR